MATTLQVAGDKSGTVTTGNTAQVLIPANPGRVGLIFQNTSAGDLWINVFGTATLASPSLKVPTNGTVQFADMNMPTGAISVIGATTAQAFTCWEF
jgi:hypothetical protein